MQLADYSALLAVVIERIADGKPFGAGDELGLEFFVNAFFYQYTAAAQAYLALVAE